MADDKDNKDDKDDDGGGGLQEVEVDTAALRDFGKWLLDRADDLTQPMANLDQINIRAGDETLFPPAGVYKKKVEDRRATLKGAMETMRNDIEELGFNMAKIADMYDATDDKSKAEADGLVPLITIPSAPATAAPPPVPPPAAAPPPAT